MLIEPTSCFFRSLEQKTNIFYYLSSFLPPLAALASINHGERKGQGGGGGVKERKKKQRSWLREYETQKSRTFPLSFISTINALRKKASSTDALSFSPSSLVLEDVDDDDLYVLYNGILSFHKQCKFCVAFNCAWQLTDFNWLASSQPRVEAVPFSEWMGA